jgi:hypothetical protein
MGNRKRLEFPSEVYPPNQASKSIIEDAIIHAAAKVDVNLVKKTTEKMHGGKFATTLACDQWRAYCPPKDASDIQKRYTKT